jgi:putative SOS response-associated peptidase YedK
MCGRYTLAERPERIKARFEIADVTFVGETKPRYNITPGQFLPVVTKNSPNTLELMKWGLVPHWAKDPRIGYKMINARAEGIESKPSFRRAFRSQRCLVPATGFYEWLKPTEKGASKKPFFIRLKSRRLFAFAGLYEVWHDAEGKELKTYSIITTEPNTLMEKIHNRMPVILREEDEATWLNPNIQAVETLLKLLHPYDESNMEAYEVSTRVNDPQNDRSDLIEPLKST